MTVALLIDVQVCTDERKKCLTNRSNSSCARYLECKLFSKVLKLQLKKKKKCLLTDL